MNALLNNFHLNGHTLVLAWMLTLHITCNI